MWSVRIKHFKDNIARLSNFIPPLYSLILPFRNKKGVHFLMRTYNIYSLA
nr:MAG TPA: hypothetical protein [Caudoviricetes sp.]